MKALKIGRAAKPDNHSRRARCLDRFHRPPIARDILMGSVPPPGTRLHRARRYLCDHIARHGPLNVTPSDAKIPRGTQDEGLSVDFIDENIEMVPRGGLSVRT